MTLEAIYVANFKGKDVKPDLKSSCPVLNAARARKHQKRRQKTRLKP